MRLLEIRLAEDPNSRLGFHPRLTVAFGLSADAREFLLSSLNAMLNGQSSGLLAKVEVDGAHVDVGPGYRRLPAPSAALDVVIQAQHLLEPRMASVSRALIAPDVGDLPDQVHKARARADAAMTSLHAIDEQIQRISSDLTEATRTRETAAVVLEQSRHDIDPYASDMWRGAIDAAERLEDELGAYRGSVRAETIDAVKKRIEALQDSVSLLSHGLDELDEIDATTLIKVCEVARLVLSPGPVPMPAAIALADEWAALRESLSSVESKYVPGGGGSQGLADALERARLELAEAESAMKPRVIAPEDASALDAAHEEVLDAERKATGRLGGNRAKKQLEMATAKRQEILDRLGYPTWAAWVMGGHMLDSTAEAKRRAEQVAGKVARLEAQWRGLSAELEADPDFQQIMARLDVVYRQAVGLVGEQDDIEAALRALRVKPGPPPISEEETYVLLAHELIESGVSIDDEAPLPELLARAEARLNEIRTVSDHRTMLAAEVDRCMGELTEYRESLSRLEALGEVDDTDVADNPRVMAARLALQESESAVDRHRQALVRSASVLAQAMAATDLEQRLVADRAAKIELRGVTATMADTAHARLAKAEQAMQDASPIGRPAPRTAAAEDESVVLARYIEQRIISPQDASLVGPVPIVFNDAFAGLHDDTLRALMHRLDRLSEHAQLIYFTDDRATARIVARDLPDSRSVVITGSGFFS